MHRAIVALGLAGTAAAFAPSAGLPGSVRRAAGVCLDCYSELGSRRRGESSSRNRAGAAMLRWSRAEPGRMGGAGGKAKLSPVSAGAVLTGGCWAPRDVWGSRSCPGPRQQTQRNSQSSFCCWRRRAGTRTWTCALMTLDQQKMCLGDAVRERREMIILRSAVGEVF